MLPLLIAMGALLFTIIGYALVSPDPPAAHGMDEDVHT
jgi:hypothetical protein